MDPGFFWPIVGALATALVAVSKFAHSLHQKLVACYEARIKADAEHLALLRAMGGSDGKEEES